MSNAHIDLAIDANGGAKWDSKWCTCDPEVGASPCPYCAIQLGLSEAARIVDEHEALLRLAEVISMVAGRLREGLTETVAAINTLLPIAEGETWDWTQKRIDEAIAEVIQLRDIGKAALSATVAAGKAEKT